MFDGNVICDLVVVYPGPSAVVKGVTHYSILRHFDLLKCPDGMGIEA
jgi:hypothetical protein